MGRESDYQHKLFVTGFNLEKRVRKAHILRRIMERIDFDFIYKEVEDTYGVKGNVSVPPPVVLKMMLLLILYNVRSERELMLTIAERLDWLWFLGYHLDDEIPNYSILSNARARWGVKAFKRFFERIVSECVEAGLVDGSKVFVDASLIDANASNNSVVDTEKLRKRLSKAYGRLENRLDDLGAEKTTPANSRFVSTTDPDASVTRHGGGKMLKRANARSAKKDIKIRRHLSERSFAWSTRYNFKEARWRRLWRMEIQDFLIAAIRNIVLLVKHGLERLSKNKGPRNRTRKKRERQQRLSLRTLLPKMLCQITICFVLSRRLLTQRSTCPFTVF
jgi:transposase